MKSDELSTLRERNEALVRELEAARQQMAADARERRATEALLCQSEERWRLIIETEPECVKLLGPDGSLRQMNAAGLRMIEADSFDEVANLCVYPLIVPEHRAQFQELTGRVFRGASGMLEFQLTGLKGTTCWLETHATPLRNEQGEIASLLAVTRNITERKLAEEALRQSQEQFQRLFQSSPLGTAIYSARDGRMLNVNARFLELFQWNLENVIGRNGLELGIWCDLGARERLLARLSQEKHIQSFEARLRSKQGQEYDTLLSAQWIEFPDGPVVMVQAHDITDRKRSEAALREKDQLLRQVIDLVPHFIFAKDSQGRFLFVNRVAAEAVGMSPEQLVGLSDLDIQRTREEAEAFMRDDREVIASGKPKFVPEEHMTDAAGRVRIYQTIKIPFLAPGTGEPALLGVAVDITEFKQAEGRIKESLSLLEATLESTADGILVADGRGRMVRFNQKFVEMWRLPNEVIASGSDEAALQIVLSQLHEPEMFLGKVRELYEQPGVSSFDLLTFRDGRRFERYSQPHRLGENIVGRVWSFRDVTERKQAEETLRENEARFRLLFEGANDAIFWADAETGLLTQCNRAAEALLGRERAEIVGQIQGFLHPPEEAARYREIFRAHASSQSKLPIEAEVVRKDGRRVSVSISPSVTAIGGRQVIQGIFHDITERKLAETALRASEERFRAVAENLGDGLVLTDLGDVLLDVNPRMLEMSGYAREEVIGRFGHEVFNPPEHAADMKARTASRASGQGGRYEIQLRRKDDSRYWAEITGAPLRDAQGHIFGTVGVIRDITARKKAEQALEMMRFSVDRAGDGVAWISREGRILYVNDALCAGRGYSCEELLGMKVFDLDPDYQPGVWGPHWQELKLHGTLTFESHHRAKDGRVFPVEINANYVHIGDQEFNFATVRDITGRKRAEQRMAAFSELGRKLSAVQTAREAGEIVIDVADHLIGWDASVVDLYLVAEDCIQSVLRKDTINGRRVDVQPVADERTPSPLARRILQCGAELILREESAGMPADSVPFGDVARPSLSLLVVPIRDGARTVGIMSIQSYQPQAYTQEDLELLQSLADHCSGALNRLRAEEEVRRLADFPQLNPNPVMELTFQAGVNYFNEAAWDLAGELGFAHPSEMLPPESAVIVRDCLASGQSQQRLEVPYGKRVVSWSFHPIPARGVVHCYAGDVTERRQLEAQLRQAQKMEAIGTLAGGIAHDFNNILGAIIGNAELASMDVSPGHPIAENLVEIRNASARAKDLVRQILSFSRQEAEVRSVMNLRSAIEEDMRLLRATLPTSVELGFQHAPDVPVVLADPTKFHQVLMNLCTNAWHAMEGQPGRISLVLDRVLVDADMARAHADLSSGLYARLVVKDDGKGMDAAMLERIFDPFFTTKETGKGTGLGLSVVHGIMKNHQGAILVASQPGQGTTFEVYFPAAPAQQHAPESAVSTHTPTPRGEGQRVLCLDDELSMLTVTTRILEREGYRAAGFTGVAGALAALRAEPLAYDLMITDYHMPGTSGLQVVREARKLRSDLPVILTSGFITDNLREEAGAAGVGHILGKPFQVDDLTQAIRRLVAISKRP